MSRFLKMILSALCLFSFSAIADTICIKNKAGVEEAWTIDAKNSGLIKTNEKCETAKEISVPVLSPVITKTLPQNFQVDQVVSSTAAMKTIEIQTAQTHQSWVATRNDQNMRLLIDKWTKSVGWNLIWAVDKDIPLESNNTFTGNFKTAVRALLSSTELSDFTIKPCFYTNNVIRVVKETTKCNPNEG